MRLNTATPLSEHHANPVRSRRPRRAARCPRFVLAAGLALVGMLLGAATGHSAPVMVLAEAANLETVMNNARNWIMGILAVVATLFLTIGGLRYLLAGGDPSEVEKAKQAVKHAAYGFAVCALAPILVGILKGILEV
ncbi:pilin [Saccharopolyspora rhizosphaerae]|uniref:pilin n=1 Tax=Saccharopolyspora rhizosphaerae TaxID=2492662 RepID=UPI0026A0D051|nr:pilin [Saccharopolyspora rhizosphaerae]